MAETEQVGRDARIMERVLAADAVILVEDGGLAGFAWAKGPGELPLSCKVSFGEDDDPPRTIRRIEVTAGWTLKDWRKMDRSALHDEDLPAPDCDDLCTCPHVRYEHHTRDGVEYGACAHCDCAKFTQPAASTQPTKGDLSHGDC
jgi:hypothetical protein